MRTPRFLSSFVVVAASAVLSASAHAVLLELEPFDYPSNTGGGLAGLNGGTGWGANAWTDGDSLPSLSASSLSLSYPLNVPLVPTGGKIELTLDAINNPAIRTLGTGMNIGTNGQEFYSSALFRRSAVTGEVTSVLFDRASDQVIRWYYGIDTNGFFSVAVDPSTATQRATSTFLAEPDVTYLVVAKMRTNTGANGNDEVFLKVFAEGSLVTEPLSDDAWDLRANGNSGVTLERVRLAMSNVAGQTNQFDELRVGTSFADVTGIPEPASVALVALGGLVLGCRRRRSL